MRPPEHIPEELAHPAACFVSLKVGGHLRGCIGTIEPTEPCLAYEIMANAVAAGTRDPRFYPVDEDELEHLEYSVDVLSPPERISGLDGHDPRKYGLIVNGQGRRGLLLPDLEGVGTADEQLSICLSKAGLPADAEVELYRFTVSRYH